MQPCVVHLTLMALGLWGQIASQQGAATRWTFTVEQRYGERPRTELVNAQTLAVDGAGRLYVAESRPAAVKVFNSEGTLLRIIGREGSNPGEYRNPG